MSKASNGFQILVFLLGTFLLSGVVQFYIINEIKTVNTFALVLLMWIPGAVAIGSSKYFRHKFRDLALIRPGNRSLMFAYSIPAGALLLMLAILILADIGKFKIPESGLLRVLVFQPTIGVLVNAVIVMGLELGWRGFLLNRMMRAHVPEPLILTGLIAALWFWPLILFVDYSSSPIPWLSIGLFTIQTVAFGVFLGWLREFSKSIYPPILAHAVHLTWIQQIIPSFYNAGKMDPYFGGQSGFVLTIIYVLLAVYIYVRHPVGRY